MIDCLDDTNVCQPFHSRRFRLLVFQNAIGEVCNLRRKLIPLGKYPGACLAAGGHLQSRVPRVFIRRTGAQNALRPDHRISADIGGSETPPKPSPPPLPQAQTDGNNFFPTPATTIPAAL